VVCRLSWLLCGFVFYLFTFPQTARGGMAPETIRGYYHHSTWTQKDGAPQGIWAITQTRDGWLWLGGSFGITRFDGVRFESIDFRPAGSTATRGIAALYSTRGGDLWVAYELGGVIRVKQGKPEAIDSFPGLPEKSILALSEDGDGRTWAVTRDQFWVLEGSHWANAGSDWNLPTVVPIVDLTLAADGSLWVGTGQGFYVLRQGSRRFDRSDNVPQGLTTMGLSSSGHLWKRDKTGYALIEEGNRRADAPPATFDQLEGSSEIFARDGSWWSVDCLKGVCRADPVDSTAPQASHTLIDDSFSAEDGLSSNRAMELFEDREGNIWVGTTLGLDQFRRNSFVSVNFPQPLMNLSLLADSKSGIWVGTDLRYANSSDSFWKIDPTPTRLDTFNEPTNSIYREADGSALVGGQSKLWRLADGKMQPLQLPPTVHGKISRLVRADTGNLWVGVEGVGTFEVVGSEWVRLSGDASLGERAPRAVARAVDGSTWLGYSNNRILTTGNGRFHTYSSSDGLGVGRVEAILSGSPMLVGGELGLELFDGHRFVALQTERLDNVKRISGLLRTTDGTLWIFNSVGAVQIGAAELKRAVIDPTHRMQAIEYDSEDGLPGGAETGWQDTKLIEDKQGRLWFAARNGLAWLTPSAIPHNDIAPTVQIQSIATSATAYSMLVPPVLPAGTRNIEINYTALSLTVPSRMKFRTQLVGVDPQWREFGNVRKASYSNLGPGQFHFQVKASNNDGVWNESPATLDFVIAPLFYQTLWFYTLCAAATLFVLWQLYRLRVHQLTRQVQGRMTARLEERERIARELHDTLLQSTQGMILLFQGFAGRLKRPDPMRDQMEGALDQADRLLSEARSRVGELRTTGTNGDLTQAIARLGAELFSDGTTAFKFTTAGAPRVLAPTIADELYLIIREALTNALRHADASIVEAEIEYGADGLGVRIRDDGKGVDEALLRDGAHSGHFGLQGMRERARHIGASFVIWGAKNAGIEIEVSVPAGAAYGSKTTRRGWIRKLQASDSKRS
jgi:signal transduction histidine kinase/ligand-binding sensor domain-containing protein